MSTRARELQPWLICRRIEPSGASGRPSGAMSIGGGMTVQRWHLLLVAVVLMLAACSDSSKVVSSDEGSSSDDVAASVEVPAR